MMSTYIDKIAELAPGETFTQSQRLPKTATLAQVTSTTAKMANTLRAAAVRANKRTGHDYHVERGHIITSSDDWMAFVFVTAREQ
jgi:hypothetical protein